ncbi:TIGR01841 family phasin [Glaciimonas immobilis]|uniref:Phasin family protein n=1 Tax=Glaciimonas immobilis TaxID=728004 RepID=A0A840RX33_9BURK|nr:TIGR01841 family phasin [Glaciimonas immobilis]KAF3996429.1 TIGR01841 family phasin [Glaciimonas immobilis]MBB5201234.1 phasin family protein [Glaciimonas immobilis]
MSNMEQFSSAAKANFESNLALFTDFTTKAFSGVEKLVELNVTAAKASFEDSAASTKKLMAAKDLQEFMALSLTLSQPNAEKALAYTRHVANIASSTKAELTKTTDAQLAEGKRKVLELIEQVTKSAPAGSESAIAFVSSAIGSATAGYEQLSKTAKQALDTMESNVNSAVDQLVQTASKSTTLVSVKK